MICCVESSKVYNTVYDLKQSLHQMPKILTLNTASTRLYIYIAVLIAVDVSVCDVTRVRCEGALCEFGHFLEFYSIATINKVSVYKSMAPKTAFSDRLYTNFTTVKRIRK